jgi:hypothetical protein
VAFAGVRMKVGMRESRIVDHSLVVADLDIGFFVVEERNWGEEGK